LGKGIREFRAAFDEAATPKTGAAPVPEREQASEQVAVAPITAQAGAQRAGAERAGAEGAGAEQPDPVQQRRPETARERAS
jgi:hypothetical protein